MPKPSKTGPGEAAKQITTPGQSLDRMALAAEWNVPEGRIGGLVTQQRRRARVASRNARVLLGLLVLTVLGGLVFYLGQPFFRQWVEGERVALDRAIRATEEQVAAARVAIDEQLVGYRETLVGAAVESGLPSNMRFTGALERGAQIWLYGSGARVLRIDAKGQLLEDTTLPHDRLALVDGSTASAQPALASPGVSTELVGLGIQAPTITGVISLSNGQVWFLMETGAIVETGEFQNVPRLIDGALGAPLAGGVEGEGGVLVYGALGAFFVDRMTGRALWHVDRDGRAVIGGPSQSQPRFPVFGHAILGDRVVLFGPTRSGFSIALDSLTSDLPETRPDQQLYGMTDAVEVGSSMVFYSDRIDTRFRYSKTASGWSSTPSDQTHRMLDVFPTQTGWAAIMDRGVFLYDADLRIVEEEFATPTVLWAGGIATDKIRLIFGHASHLMANGAEGQWYEVPVPQDSHLTRAFPLADGILLSDVGGGALIYGDLLAESFDRLLTNIRDPGYQPEPGVALTLDANLFIIGKAHSFLDQFRKRMAPHNQGRGLEYVAAVNSIASQAEVYEAQLAEDRARQQRYRTFPYSLIWERDLERFEDFMTTCRAGGTDLTDGAAPAPLTLACLEGWEAQKAAERENWWQALAVQVPPGILLLFLLATLGGLYRYNIRMAGFHHGRADALELLSEGIDADGITALEKASAALAADAVPFGKGGETPSDQAVKLAQALRG